MVRYFWPMAVTLSLYRTSKGFFEQFLRTMLRWDPEKRGGRGNRHSNTRDRCWSLLDNILNSPVSTCLLLSHMLCAGVWWLTVVGEVVIWWRIDHLQLLFIYCVTKNEMLTYPVEEKHTIQDVVKALERETQIRVSDMELIFTNGIVPAIGAKAKDYCGVVSDSPKYNSYHILNDYLLLLLSSLLLLSLSTIPLVLLSMLLLLLLFLSSFIIQYYPQYNYHNCIILYLLHYHYYTITMNTIISNVAISDYVRIIIIVIMVCTFIIITLFIIIFIYSGMCNHLICSVIRFYFTGWERLHIYVPKADYQLFYCRS